MARMDHYKNGKWVGSTEIEGNSNTTGWVNTYSADGNVRSTMIQNTNTFDYKPEQHPPKSIEQIQNERAGKEAIDKLFGKIFAPLMISGALAVVVAVCGVILYEVMQFLPSEIIQNLKSIGTIILIVGSIIFMILGFVVVIFIYSKMIKKFKEDKKNKK